MNILGITHPISWNPAACLLIDGELVTFAEEERFIRVKHAPHAYPRNAIALCLQRAGIEASGVDITAIGFQRPEVTGLRAMLDELDVTHLTDDELFEYRTALATLHADDQLRTFGKREYFDHHLCHAASAAIPSAFAQANVITLDGWGGASSGMFGTFDRQGRIDKIADVNPYSSWGSTYELITDYLGFSAHSGEGKTMGLASYGQVDPVLLPNFCEGRFRLPNVRKYERFLARTWKQRARDEELTDRHRNLAATVQSQYEESLVAIAHTLAEETGIRKFVLAGGVALNCTGNGHLARQDFIEDIFVQPASHDAGTALGAAILAHRQATGSWPAIGFRHAYWGADFSSGEIQAALAFAKVPYEPCDPCTTAAHALARNQVVGWFQGAAEVGPRALGHRSILAHPGFVGNVEHINKRVKRREPWRPLAPSVLAERFHDIFELPMLSPFMLMAAPVREPWRSRLAAIVHVDHSARPQAVEVETNPMFHRMIGCFEGLTGLPAVLNTSFNLDDEPLVNSPEQAIATFCRSGLDVLILGNFVLRK